MTLVLGVDAGGTSTRAVVATLDGEIAGRGTAGGGNPVTIPNAMSNLTTAIKHSLSGIPPSKVTAITLVLAAPAPLRDPATLSSFHETLKHLGLTPIPAIIGDAVAAFAAGTATPSGTVLISGTGAIAAKIIDHTIAGTADGYGWLLGDEGSAFWLGQAAARAAIRATPTLLTTLVTDHLLRNQPTRVAIADAAAPTPDALTTTSGTLTTSGTADTSATTPDALTTTLSASATAEALGATADAQATAAGTSAIGDPLAIAEAEATTRALAAAADALAADALATAVDTLATAVHARPPLALAELAPLVTQAALAGDPTALAIVAEAAARLTRTLRQVHEPGSPIVLAGSVLTTDGPVRQAVVAHLPDERITIAADGAAAAAWLAARPFLTPEASRHLHTRLLTPKPHPT